MAYDFDQPDVTICAPEEPELVVVGGVHGDERSGDRAVCRLREAEIGPQRGVAFVLAKPAAFDANERYIDTDLSRGFPETQT